MRELLINGTGYVQNSVAISRNTEEKWEISNGNITYSNLAAIVFQNLDTIDQMIEKGSELAGQYAAVNMTEHQYHNHQDNFFKRFVNRNVYIDPAQKEKYALQRQGVYAATRFFTEFLLKNAVRLYLNNENEKNKYKIYREMYRLMSCFVNNDRQAPGHSRASRELSKIRSSFDLPQQGLIKIKEDVDQSSTPVKFSVNNEFLGNLDDKSRDGLSFCMTSLAAQMYDNDTDIIKSRLSNYFDVLGCHGNRQREVIRANCNDYDKILEQQHKMHIIASQMVQHLIPSSPSIDISEIMNRSQELKQFDPYEERRNKNQERINKAAKVVKTLGACFLKFPDLSFLASLEALSQFNLNNDNIANDCYNQLRQWCDSDSDAENTIKSAIQISDSAKEFS